VLRIPSQLEHFAVCNFRHYSTAPETHFAIGSDLLYPRVPAPGRWMGFGGSCGRYADASES